MDGSMNERNKHVKDVMNQLKNKDNTPLEIN